MDGGAVHSALLIAGDRVAWVGDAADAPVADRVTDLEGRTVIPGLTDAHLHIFMLALSRRQLSFGRTPAADMAELIAMVRRAAAERPDELWVQGCALMEDRLAERRLPTRLELDEAVPDRAVLLRRYCGHVAVMNSMAMAELGLSPGTPDGALDGIAEEAAAEAVFHRAPAASPEILVGDIEAAIAECLSYGITAAVEAAVGFSIGYDREAEVWQALRAKGRQPIRMGFMLQLTADEATRRGLQPRFDTDWSIETLKFFADGIIGGRSGALSAPYADTGGRGVMIYPEGALEAEILAAHRAGWRVAVHATGDIAIERVARAYEAAFRAYPRPEARPRIEHLFVPPPGIFARMADMGAVTVMQPSFLRRMGGSIAAGLGARTRTAYPGASVLAAGAQLTFSSDAPTGLLSPWDGVAAAVDRMGGHGGRLGPDEALTRRQAVSAYVAGGAHAMRHETVRGTLHPGQAADLAVFDRDPLEERPGGHGELRAAMVVVRGETVRDARV